ncbi:MAG: hypothetical protein ACRENG_19460, partial [bacterium]
MGRIIHDQTIASTHIDSHGEKLTWAELQSFFNQLDVSTPTGVMHDTSRPPAVRFLGKRLTKLPDGELAIKIDYEILDEDTFANMGGFSISFTRLTHRYGSGHPVFCVLINPRQFDFEEASKLIQSCVPSDITFDVAERIEKGDVLTTAIIAVMVFTGLQ